jgi:hypothetical protein
MNSIYEGLLDNSLQAALSSIEIYNKPDFKYREQVFVILNVNAWELLLKAKILKDAGDNLTSLYVPLSDGVYKLNRCNNPLTIDINKAINQLALDKAISENLNLLIEIRDTVVHFYQTNSLSYIVYTLGVASLRNYHKLIKDWFAKSLLEYNFYILPLAFAYNFQTLSLLELEKENTVISNILKSATETQASIDSSSEFYFVCEVGTEIKSAKKFIGQPDFTTVIDTNLSTDSLIVIKEQRSIDKYPLSYLDLYERIKNKRPGTKQTQVNKVIKDYKLKENPKYSTYSFTSKSQEEKYKQKKISSKNLISIYNDDAVRFIIEHIEDNQ